MFDLMSQECKKLEVRPRRGAIDEVMLKLLYPALTNISKKRTMQIKDWKSALNQFSIIFAEKQPYLCVCIKHRHSERI